MFPNQVAEGMAELDNLANGPITWRAQYRAMHAFDMNKLKGLEGKLVTLTDCESCDSMGSFERHSGELEYNPRTGVYRVSDFVFLPWSIAEIYEDGDIPIIVVE